MTEDELKALVASLAVGNKELREFQAETTEQMKRTDEKLEREGITLGNLCRDESDIAEEFFYNSLIKDLHLGSMQFEDITKNMEKHW